MISSSVGVSAALAALAHKEAANVMAHALFKTISPMVP
jgi:hypothetical protein